MEEKLTLYLQGNWFQLADQLTTEIKHDAMIGDSVHLTTKLSQLGCCHLLLGNQGDAYVLYQFLQNAYDKETHFSMKERANVLRFLALYSLWDGDITRAENFYNQAINAACIMEDEPQEVMILVEAARWYYSLNGNREKMIFIRNKLKDYAKCLFPLDTIDNPSTFWNYLQFYTKNENDSHPLMKQFLHLHEAIEKKQQTDNQAQLLLAHCYQYKHPLLNTWAKYFAGAPTDEATPPLHREKIKFTLFNQFTICVNDGTIPHHFHWKRKKAEELLILLLIQPQLQAEKDWILEELYPNEDHTKVSNRLYVNINSVNKTMKEISKKDAPLIFIKNNKVSLNLSLIEEIDVQIYLKLHSVGKHLWYGNREEAVEIFHKARQIYSPHFAEHLPYVPWLEQFRITLKSKHQELLQKLYYYSDDPNLKGKLLQEMLDGDPYNERTIKEKYTFLQAQGRSFEAEQFLAHKRMQFQAELGIDFNMDVLI